MTTTPTPCSCAASYSGIYASNDVATRDTFIAVVREQASREDASVPVSVATVGRVVLGTRTTAARGGVKASATALAVGRTAKEVAHAMRDSVKD